MLKTKCAICGEYLIEGGEHDGDNIGELIINLSCPNCEADYLIRIYEPYGKELLNINN